MIHSCEKQGTALYTHPETFLMHGAQAAYSQNTVPPVYPALICGPVVGSLDLFALPLFLW